MELNSSLKNKTILCSLTYGNSFKKLRDIGILKRELEIYEELCKFYKKVYLINYDDRIDDFHLPNKLNIIYINQKKNIFFRLTYNIYFLLKLSKKLKIDYIRTNQTYTSIFFLILKLIFRSNLIARMGHESYYFVKNFSKKKIKIFYFYINNYLLYKFSNYIFVPNEEIKDFINKRFRIELNKIYVVQNYISKGFFLKKRYTRKKQNKFIYIGRINKDKIDETYLNLIKKLNIKIDVYGKIEDKLLIKNNKILNYKGIINNEEIPNLLLKYNYYISLSKIDQCPKSIYEAMKMGLIVITIRFFGSNFLSHKQNCLILKNENLNEIKSFIKNKTEQNFKKIINNATIDTKYLSSELISKKEVSCID